MLPLEAFDRMIKCFPGGVNSNFQGRDEDACLKTSVKQLSIARLFRNNLRSSVKTRNNFEVISPVFFLGGFMHEWDDGFKTSRKKYHGSKIYSRL